jgi:hypothetical protein
VSGVSDGVPPGLYMQLSRDVGGFFQPFYRSEVGGGRHCHSTLPLTAIP